MVKKEETELFTQKGKKENLNYQNALHKKGKTGMNTGEKVHSEKLTFKECPNCFGKNRGG